MKKKYENLEKILSNRVNFQKIQIFAFCLQNLKIRFCAENLEIERKESKSS